MLRVSILCRCACLCVLALLSVILASSVTSAGAVLPVDVTLAVAASPTLSAAPLVNVSVCAASATTCTDLAMLSALLTVFVLHNRRSDALSHIAPVVIATGNSGVAGLLSFLQAAPTCSVVTGPGRANVVLTFTPVINEYALTQLEYNAAMDALSGGPEASTTYPYLSRTALNESAVDVAYGDLCAYFSWERVVLVSSDDRVGRERARAMAASMLRRHIHVERTYTINGTVTAAALTAVLDTVYARDVSRIVIVLLPLYGADADMFFRVVGALPYVRQYMFILGRELCQHGYVYPAQRRLLVSSMCVRPYMLPQYTSEWQLQLAHDATVLREVAALLRSVDVVADALARCPAAGAPSHSRTTADDADGGSGSVDKSEQRLASIVAWLAALPFTAFAHDAAHLVVDVVDEALRQSGGVLPSSATLLRSVRNATFAHGATGVFALDARGSRDAAVLQVDVQLAEGDEDGGSGGGYSGRSAAGDVVVVGQWDGRLTPSYRAVRTRPWRWMTNSSDVPLDTFRDMSFVLGAAVSASPGTIVLSVLGFVGTIAVFFFCYRHYRVQKLMEVTLEGSDVPITEAELQRLRVDV